MEFEAFNKIPRLSREIVITEKIDGTNAQVAIFNTAALERKDLNTPYISTTSDGIDWAVFVGSRTIWLTERADNKGFFAWVYAHVNELVEGLGEGRHYGEWWGQGIGRKYGLNEKRFSLFNTSRWTDTRPACCHVVPELYKGDFTTEAIDTEIEKLREFGSIVAPGFMKPEGVVIFHTAGNLMFKKTLENDEKPKSLAQNKMPLIRPYLSDQAGLPNMT